jgi:hypothetical protein
MTNDDDGSTLSYALLEAAPLMTSSGSSSASESNSVEGVFLPNNPIYSNLDIRFFPRESYHDAEHGKQLVRNFRVWGHNIDFNSHLDRIIIEQSGFSLQSLRNHADGGHNCIGSQGNKDAMIRFDVSRVARESFLFGVKDSKDRGKYQFSVELTTLHSWDTSYIGDMSCSLFEREKSADAAIATVKIQGDQHEGKHVHDSTPRSTLIGQFAGDQNMILECKSLDERLSCIARLALFYHPAN